MIEQIKITPVILCGGSGTRLWPYSTHDIPKQFLPLLPDGSTFRATLQRISDINIYNPPVIVTNLLHSHHIERELSNMKMVGDILCEPEKKDTAFAIALANDVIFRKNPNSIVLVLASDHLISDNSEFQKSVIYAIPQADNNKLVVFGLVPTDPATRFGYISYGKMIEKDVYVVDKFYEKPLKNSALQYVKEGMLWNSGNLLFKSGVMRAEMILHCPLVIDAAEKVFDSQTMNPIDLVPISIDYALLEKSNNIVVYRSSYYWADMGTWETLFSFSAKNVEGNIEVGNVSAHNTTNSVIMADKGTVVVMGLNDVVVVSHNNNILVTSRDMLNSLKNVVNDIN